MSEKQFDLDYVFSFGLHKGEPLWKVIEEDTSYITWMIENKKWFLLDNEAFKLYQDIKQEYSE